jgi:hypothetical protein
MTNIQMPNPPEWWYEHMTRIAKSDYAACADADDVRKIVTEAERRGYEKAMKEVREAVIPTAATLTLANEETIDVYYIPKSFVLR